jgi:ligand-binding SRPBCC domain-containing protein
MSIKISQVRQEFRLESEFLLPHPIADVFPYFAEAKNLENLTPPILRFEITSPDPIEMSEGRLIDYRLRIRGMPIAWTSLISLWDPPHRFVDEQIRGPYRYWIHQHVFESCGNETLVKDFVRYQVFGGTIIHSLFVKPDLNRIFSYRHQQLQQRFS